jgi:hypothetical protein
MAALLFVLSLAPASSWAQSAAGTVNPQASKAIYLFFIGRATRD